MYVCLATYIHSIYKRRIRKRNWTPLSLHTYIVYALLWILLQFNVFTTTFYTYIKNIFFSLLNFPSFSCKWELFLISLNFFNFLHFLGKIISFFSPHIFHDTYMYVVSKLFAVVRCRWMDGQNTCSCWYWCGRSRRGGRWEPVGERIYFAVISIRFFLL